MKSVYVQNNIPIPKAEEVFGLKEHQGIETMKKALPQLLVKDSYLKKLQLSTQENPSLAKKYPTELSLFFREWAEGNMLWMVFRHGKIFVKK